MVEKSTLVDLSTSKVVISSISIALLMGELVVVTVGITSTLVGLFLSVANTEPLLSVTVFTEGVFLFCGV